VTWFDEPPFSAIIPLISKKNMSRAVHNVRIKEEAILLLVQQAVII